MTPYIISEHNAAKIARWLKRGPVALYRSINLSNPGEEWLVPHGDSKPNWQAANEPERILTVTEIAVVKYVEVKRFRVGIRMGSQGLSVKVTDGGTRRIRAAVAKAGEGAFYSFDYSTQEAVIWKPDGEPIPLTKWIEERQ
jgi:hypothetical protein